MSTTLRLKNPNQRSRGASPWSFKEALIIRVWEIIWSVFVRWTPKKFNRFRLTWLRLFGAKIHGCPFIFPSAKIYAPFNLELFDRACVGPSVNVYNLGKVIVRENSVISQETMLCGGTHDLSLSTLPLLVGDIELGEEVFVGARAIILPGINIGSGAVVGAGAVVTKDVEPWAIVAGNPAKFIKKRVLKDD